MYIKSRALASLITLAALFGIVQAPPFSRAAGERKLEVFSWWTSGGEAAALDALFNTYKKQYPGVEIINATVAGGGGSAARPVLQTRLAGGNPPDTWQSHPGWEMLGQYVEPGYCEPITDLYKSYGWDKAFPKAPAAFQQALNDAVTAFIVDKNVDNFAHALVQAAKESSEATK